MSASALGAQVLPQSASITATAVDANGLIYLAGNISTGDLPVTPGVFEPSVPRNVCGENAGFAQYCNHGFVAKLPPSGDRLVWATYLAGDGEDTISALAVDSGGRVFVAGSTTSTALLLRPGPFAPSPYRATPASLFVYELSADGSFLLGGTFFGGSGQDQIADMKLDSSGHVYIAGTAVSDPFPTTPGVYQPNRSAGYSDQFVAEFDPSLTRLLLSTLVGGTVQYTASALALGPDATIYVTGTAGYLRGPGPAGGVLTRLSPDGASVIDSLFNQEVISGIYTVAVDSASNVYYGTDSRAFGLAPPEGAVTKLDVQGNQLASQQALGSIRALAAGPDGALYVFGFAQVGLLATTPGAPNPCELPGFGVWRPYAAQLDSASLSIRYAGFARNAIALAGPGGVLVQKGAYTVVPIGTPPSGTITCMANAASFDGSVIAPGEILAVFGNQIGPIEPVGGQLDPAGNFTFALAGFTVSIGGLPAPLLYASGGQINLVVPFAIPTTGYVHVEIRRNGAVQGAFDQAVSPQNPGLFTADGSGAGLLAALNQDGSVNGPDNPAHPGQIMSVFATGLGAMTPQPVDGSRPLQPVFAPLAPPQVLVNGYSAEIDYMGNAPGLVQGGVQINFRLPVGIHYSDFSPNSVGIALYPGTNIGTVAVRYRSQPTPDPVISDRPRRTVPRRARRAGPCRAASLRPAVAGCSLDLRWR